MATTKMTVKVDEKAGTLTVTLPIIKPPKPSSTGKTLMVASTAGAAKTETEINGKDLIVNLNAYIYATDKKGSGGAREASSDDDE